MTKFVIFDQLDPALTPVAVNPDWVAGVEHYPQKAGPAAWRVLMGQGTFLYVRHDGDLASLIHRLKHGPEQLPPKKED